MNFTLSKQSAPLYAAKPHKEHMKTCSCFYCTAKDLQALDGSAGTNKQQSLIQRPNLILGLHHLTKGKIDARLRDAQHLGNTVCPMLLSAAFHNYNIARGKTAVPLIRVIGISTQQKASCGSKGHRSCTSHSSSILEFMAFTNRQSINPLESVLWKTTTCWAKL